MTSRTNALRYPEGTTNVGTARVREDRSIGRSFAERELMRRTGNAPHSTFDEVADGTYDVRVTAIKADGETIIGRTLAESARTAAQIGQPEPLGKAIERLTKPAIAAKKPKYGNQKCESGGIKFDSKREMARWHELVQMQARGEIAELELQVPFILAEPVVIAGRKRPALRYVADFVYEQGGETVIEDVKGRVTEGYRIKRHLMAARGLMIKEVK